MFLSIEKLTHEYMPGTPFAVKALQEVSLQVEKGEFVALVGETGSGKTTLAQHLNGLLSATSGKVVLEGIEVGSDKKSLAALRRRVGLLFQFPEQQLFEETVFADISFGPKNLGLQKEEIQARVEKAMKQVGLAPGLADCSPFTLSGGQMRRVAMAGVLAMRPEVLVLDEPAAGLDPRGRKEIMDTIARMHQEEGLTVFLISHNMEEVARLANRVVVLDAGSVKFDGTPAEVFSRAGVLEETGLEPPQMMQLMQKLRNKGMDVPPHVLSVDEALPVMLQLLRGEKR